MAFVVNGILPPLPGRLPCVTVIRWLSPPANGGQSLRDSFAAFRWMVDLQGQGPGNKPAQGKAAHGAVSALGHTPTMTKAPTGRDN